VTETRARGVLIALSVSTVAVVVLFHGMDSRDTVIAALLIVGLSAAGQRVITRHYSRRSRNPGS
jgi:hypothetical protein